MGINLTLLLDLGLVVLDTGIIYLFLILVLSLRGQRQISELSAIELLVIMILGSSVETAMIGGDTSLLAGLTSAATLFICNHLLSISMQRWHWLRRLVVGRPYLLVHNGRLLPKELDKADLTVDDVLEGIRERGYDNLDQVRIAVKEMDGAISVVPRETFEKRSAGKGAVHPSS